MQVYIKISFDNIDNIEVQYIVNKIKCPYKNVI